MKTGKTAKLCALAGAGVIAGLAGNARAGIIDGEYQLANHPDGVNAPPYYGLVLHNLFDAPGSKKFTFDFNHENSDMRMTVDSEAGTIRIFGNVMGGRDVGDDWINDAFLGVYEVDFTYDTGVSLASGDDDFEVRAPALNSGFIKSPYDYTINLFDKANTSGQKFRLGNEDNDQGHRGFKGMSGWGWLEGDDSFRGSQITGDFLFTVVPAPGTVVLGGMSMFCFAGRRRSA